MLRPLTRANTSTDWDFDRRGSLAIEKTALWYKDSELSTVQELMEAHKEKTRQSVLSQLIGYNGTWGSFSTAKKDLQITIEASSDPIPEAHSLFHVEIQGGIHVSISLRNASLGFITIIEHVVLGWHAIPLHPSAPCGSLTGDRASAARRPHVGPTLAPVAGFIDPVDEIPGGTNLLRHGPTWPTKRRPSRKSFIREGIQEFPVDLKSHRSVQSHTRFLWYNECIIHAGGAVCDQLCQIMATPGEAWLPKKGHRSSGWD